ncbi:hypothetical protein DEJ05_04150 [Curtobacterium sp. MCLR17_045]|nr:hypothetical protein DEJ05_04150 [Curtobacterium sp. MCLR17_045]
MPIGAGHIAVDGDAIEGSSKEFFVRVQRKLSRSVRTEMCFIGTDAITSNPPDATGRHGKGAQLVLVVGRFRRLILFRPLRDNAAGVVG